MVLQHDLAQKEIQLAPVILIKSSSSRPNVWLCIKKNLMSDNTSVNSPPSIDGIYFKLLIHPLEMISSKWYNSYWDTAN